MTSKSLRPSTAGTADINTTKHQDLALREADVPLANAMNAHAARYMIPDQSDLVEKVTGVSSIGEYSRIIKDFEALGHAVGLDPHSLHQRLYQKARTWFNPVSGSEDSKGEVKFYPAFKAFLYLLALLVRDKRRKLNLPLERYLLPHTTKEGHSDLASRNLHDVAIRWYDPDTDVEKEGEAFLEIEQLKSKRKLKLPSKDQIPVTPGPMPATKHSDGEKKPEESPQKTQNDVTQGPFWRCFGVVAYKAECPKDHSKDDYGQLGWYFHSALQAVFERNTMWGWVVSESAVRFVFFTHSTGVSSEVIDMKGEAGRKIFMDNFIRLCLCSAYRAGFDPTKRWLEDDKKWEVKCFNSANPEKGESLLAYVNPLPFKISNSFYGRRTRCHLGSLTKDAETYDLILKESWVELDQDPDKPKTMNTESLPNEVRIFQEINKHKGENTNKFIAKGVPTMKAGGSVYINGDISPGSGCFSTVANYCGELDIIHREYDMQRYILPKTESSSDFVYFRSYPTTESSADITMPKFKVVNRIHQRLLMSPIGEPMSALHTWHRSPKYPKEFEQMDRSDQRGYNVLLLFTKLFWIIYYLWKDCNVYHRDLSEGNVLVCENNGYPFPLLIDFDHSRLCSDVGNDSEQLLMGTVPFMSILNLAGYSHKLSIVDELESFLYLWLWKCTTGFTPSGSTSTRTTSISSHPRVQPVTRLKLTNQSRPALAGRRRPQGVAKEPEVWKWAQGNPRGYSLNWKMGHTTNGMLYSFVTRELRPEFRTFEPMFYRFRRVLFDWDGQQQLFNSGKLTRKRETKPQDDSSTGNNGNVDMSKIRDATPVQCHQTENSTTSDDSIAIDAYYERLISRAEEANDILGRFAYVIKHPFAR